MDVIKQIVIEMIARFEWLLSGLYERGIQSNGLHWIQCVFEGARELLVSHKRKTFLVARVASSTF